MCVFDASLFWCDASQCTVQPCNHYTLAYLFFNFSLSVASPTLEIELCNFRLVVCKFFTLRYTIIVAWPSQFDRSLSLLFIWNHMLRLFTTTNLLTNRTDSILEFIGCFSPTLFRYSTHRSLPSPPLIPSKCTLSIQFNIIADQPFRLSLLFVPYPLFISLPCCLIQTTICWFSSQIDNLR